MAQCGCCARAARGAGLPVTGVQPRHVTTRRGQAGVPSPPNGLAHIVSCVTHWCADVRCAPQVLPDDFRCYYLKYKKKVGSRGKAKVVEGQYLGRLGAASWRRMHLVEA